MCRRCCRHQEGDDRCKVHSPIHHPSRDSYLMLSSIVSRGTYMAGRWCMHTKTSQNQPNRKISYVTMFIFSAQPNETLLYEYSSAKYVCAQQRSGRIPKASCRWTCQAHPPPADETEKLCCGCPMAGSVVAPATRSSVC